MTLDLVEVDEDETQEGESDSVYIRPHAAQHPPLSPLSSQKVRPNLIRDIHRGRRITTRTSTNPSSTLI